MLSDGVKLSPDGLTRAADGTFYALDGSRRLVSLTADGQVLSAWELRDGSQRFAGGAGLAKRVITLPDGSIGVLDVEGARVLRFGTGGLD